MAPTTLEYEANTLLWAQATAIWNICSLVPNVLEFKGNTIPKWRTFLNISVTTYTLEDHLTTKTPSNDPSRVPLDAIV
jgi:hypothetical protein